LQQRRPASATFPEKANIITKQTIPANFLMVSILGASNQVV
jgi:hypothetical protein